MTHSTSHQLDLFRGLNSATLERRRRRTTVPAGFRDGVDRVLDVPEVSDLDQRQSDEHRFLARLDEHRHGRGRLANPQHLTVRRIGPARQVSGSLYTFKGLSVDQLEKSCRAAAPVRGTVRVRFETRAKPQGRLRSTPGPVAEPRVARRRVSVLDTALASAPRRRNSSSAALSYLFVAVTLACTFLV